MKKIIGVMTLMFCFTAIGFCNATVETFDPDTGTGTLGPGGEVE